MIDSLIYGDWHHVCRGYAESAHIHSSAPRRLACSCAMWVFAMLWHHVDYRKVQHYNQWFEDLVLIQSVSSLSWDNLPAINFLKFTWTFIEWFYLWSNHAFEERHKGTICHYPAIAPCRTGHPFSPCLCSRFCLIRSPLKSWFEKLFWTQYFQDSISH